MHFFITGHTGFKGAWLTLLLRQLGHKVSGLALEPVDGGLFGLTNLETEMESHVIADIRDFAAVNKAMQDAKPDFAIHMAAQPLVLRSYEDPIETYTTNVDGTLNFLRALANQGNPPTSLVVTTDKVYRDTKTSGYEEEDALGGTDPYSASKSMADILTQSWIVTHPEISLGVARAGNVVGAFDVSENRLVPDIQRSLESGESLVIRNPDAIRPWQHVLDCLFGYLLMIDKLGRDDSFPKVLNFGPRSENFKSVTDVILVAKQRFPSLSVEIERATSPLKETRHLTLDASKATNLLAWKNEIDFESSINMSLITPGTPARAIVIDQISSYIASQELSNWRLGGAH